MEAKHSWLRTPFGDGYRISAQAYRTQLTAEGLRVLLPQGHAVKQSPVSSIATIREDGSFDLTAIAQKLCHDRLRRLVLWEVLAVFLQSLVVLSLGLVLQELEFGLPTWLSLLGEAAEHPAWRSVPFALLIVLARFLQQVAKHRRVKIVEQASSALCAFLFRRATTSGAAAACSVAELLNAVPRLVEATAKGSRLQLAAPMLGLSLGFGLLLMTLGAMAPLLLLLQLLLLGLEVLLRKLTPRWKQEAMHLREQREAMSAAALAMEMGCASATVKLFAWESAVWARLQQLRKREKAALQRLQRLEVLASVARELGVFVPVAVALLLQWLVFGMSLWACFQALAACRMTAQQLRRAQQVLLTKIPQVNACLEQELERTAPKQGDRSTYKSARYAVAIDSMRFFWEEPQEVQALPPKPNGNTALQTVMQKAEKGVSSGLDLVDSVSDDASVAERARRSTNTSNRFDLKVLSLQVKRGSHVALVGATGSGKSTLLAGLVGGCQCEHWGDDREGGVSLSGRLAYAPQRPCVKLADCSIRENVLCGRSFDAQRYEQALTTSTLAEDLQRLSNGDSALVEELAGPGLAAMQVARALFAEAQILLLDDPFVEMDHDRGKRAVSSLVKKYKDRTMILATQNLSLLSPLDSIIVLRNGTVFEQGDYKTLSSMPTELSRLLLISNQKESRRREGHGLPCPCICYEVGPDPMRELYPMDELFGTFPSFGHPSKAPKRWVSALQAVAVHRPSSRTVKAEAAPPSWERLNRRGSLDLMMDALRDVSDVDAGEPGVTDALLRAPRASSSSKAPQTAGEEVSGDGLQDLAKHHEAGRTPGIQSLPEDEDVYEDDKFGQLLQSMDDEGGPLDRVENKVHRRLPSASAVPMVGASEAGGYAGYTADSPGESIDQRSPTSPEVPSDQRIPRPNSSPSGHVNSDRMPLPDDTAQWAPGDDAVGTLAPGSPESADGLRRRVPLADLEEKRPPSHLRPEGQHGAPAPQTLGKPREEDTLKRRRADKEDPRTQRMDVLEKALKEKNDKIAELEKQVAKSGNIEKKELLRGSSSSSFLEGRFGHAPGRSSSRRGRGLSVLLLGRVGCSFWMLVLLVLVSTGIQLAVPVVLSYIFAPTWRMSTTAEPTISIPSPSIATEPTTETTSTTASETSGVAVPTFPSDVVVDDSEVVWRGFATSTAPASTTTTTTTTTTLASTEAEIEQDWSIKLQGHFCHEPNLAQETRPQGIYDLDPTIGWHWASTLSLQACKKACEDLIAWGCRFISWGGPVAPKRWCYVHQQCAEVMNVHFYQVFEMNMTDGSRRLQRHGDEAQDAQGGQGDGGSLPKIFSRPMVPVLPGPRRAFVTDETDLPAWLSTNSLEAALAGLCLFLPLLSVSQARLAADVGMQASQQNAEKQMKAVLSAAGDLGGASMFWAEGSLFPQAADMVPLRERPSLLKDVADADEFLPLPLARGLAAAAQVLAALLCAAAASGRQAVLAVSLTIVLGLSIYLHRMRLPFLHQIRRIASVTEDAAALRLKHLAECYEVLRVHGRLQTLSDDYEALCHDRALVATAADAAGRWLYTRLHCCVSLLVGLLCFSTLTQAPTALPSRMGLAVSIAALVQVAVLPDAVVELVKYGGLSTHGLAALRRMYQLVKETQSEELESPIFSVSRGELPTDRRGLGQPIHRARSGKVALGDLMVDNELPEDVIKSKKEQSFSVVGFPVEKVPADWPYFGAVEFEDVTVRYSTELSPSVSECSLRVPAGKALLVVGEESCGKSTLLRTLLRLAPETQEAGRVLVDGIDTRSVGLSTLRGRVAVVPQELVLYRGTWLQNLDPMEEFSEEEVQMVLRLTRFENWMLRHAPDGLHQTLEEGGAPHGAAAVLLGVSRAMLRLLQKRSKLLLMDATTCRLSASSDADLTALVLRYCRRAAVAVMQVSRRVQQAPLYDEVAVMALGRILEQGPAKKLWVKDGALRRMAKEQGLDSAKMTKADALSARLGSVWGWEVSPQESPAWQDEFTVGMKKVKAEKEKKDSR